MKWFNQSDLGYYRGGAKVIEYFNQNINNRRNKYDYVIKKDYHNLISSIEQNGYAKIENFYDKETINAFRNEFLSLIAEGKHTIYVQNNNHIQLKDIFLNSKYALDIATDSRLINIATSFFKCFPGLGTFNLRQSFVNHQPASSTCQFHRDFNSPVKILKFFFYLEDVGLPNGPFTYVEGSNRIVPAKPHWWNDLGHRVSDEQIANIYGVERIKYLTAKAGDLLIATTNGYHKGQKIMQGTREMFTINYLIHPEMDEANPATARARFKIRKQDYDKLPDWKKPVCDFLIKV